MPASNRSLLFLLGLVLGLLAGAGFFIFKMDDIMKKVNLFSGSKDTIIIQQQPVIEKEKADVKRYIGKKDTSKNNMSSAEMLASKYSREIPIRRVMAEADSLLRDSATGRNDQGASENFIVRKDELLDTRNFQVVNLTSADPVNPSDSLLEKVSGIKNQKNTGSPLKVEFWQSPINYKGFKMTKNKIVLFGISTNENLKLFHLEDDIFLKLDQGIFRMYFTDDFKQFEKVTDASLIAKMK